MTVDKKIVILDLKGMSHLLQADDREDRIIAIDHSDVIIKALSGDGHWFTFLSNEIEIDKVMGRPDFDDIKIIDGGHTVCFGDHYEVAADGLRYFFDSEYKKVKDNGRCH